MHYRRAVQKLRELTEACDRTRGFSPGEPFLREVYAYGDVLDGADPIEWIQLALAVDLPPDQVPWGSSPRETEGLVSSLRLDKGGFGYRWRSRHEPVWNHWIHDPVRFWSLDGPDEAVLTALAERRFADLPRLTASPDELRQRVEVERDRALAHLRSVHGAYWDNHWRREHRGAGRYPEHHLWDAVDGYVDLSDAAGDD